MDQKNQLTPIGIEGLVNWAFEEEKTAMMVGRDRGIGPILSHLQKTTVSYGERVSGGGSIFAGGYDMHPDALVVYGAWLEVRAASPDGGCLIRSYGEAGYRPDWVADGELRFVADVDPVTGLTKQARDQHRNLVKESCRIKRVGKLPEIVRVARSEYRVWWAALFLLQELVREVEAVQGGLVRWKLTGEMPPQEPWTISGYGNGLAYQKVA